MCHEQQELINHLTAELDTTRAELREAEKRLSGIRGALVETLRYAQALGHGIEEIVDHAAGITPRGKDPFP